MKLLSCVVILLACVCPLLAQPDGPTLVNSGAGTVEMSISGSGSPAVIFESGFSDTYEYWNAVVATISSKTKSLNTTVQDLGIPN